MALAYFDLEVGIALSERIVETKGQRASIIPASSMIAGSGPFDSNYGPAIWHDSTDIIHIIG